MSSVFDEFFNEFFKLKTNNFNRPVKDMQPYHYIQNENGFTFVINTLGINKKDIEVEIGTQPGEPYRILTIKGATKMPSISFENRIDVSVRLRFDDEIEDLAYETKDGLTIIYLKVKVDKPEEKKLEARELNSDEDFDFGF